MARGLLMQNVKTPFTRRGNSDFRHFKTPRVLTAPCFYPARFSDALMPISDAIRFLSPRDIPG